MSTMAEIQVRLGRRPERNVLPCDPTFARRLKRAETAWGGPLPGWATGIQAGPLRVEIAGQPPLRALQALQLPLMCAQVAKFWQLRPVERTVGVYHWRLGWCPLPPLPGGVSLQGGNHPSFRQMVSWDTGTVLSMRVYVSEWVRGIVAAQWPRLVDPSVPADGWDQVFAIDYGGDLQVTAITRYDYPLDSLTPAMVEQVRLRLAVMKGSGR